MSSNSTALTRKEFLRGKGFRFISQTPLYYLRLGRSAMACRFEVFIRPSDRCFIPAVHGALDEIERLEDQLSVFRERSELSRINRNAAEGPVSVDRKLYELLRMAQSLGMETCGAFDISAGALTRCWGFLHREGKEPSADSLEMALSKSGWRNLEFDDEQHSIRFRRSGVELNLGAIGKGYALDCAASYLRNEGLRDFLLHAGHSSIMASGSGHSGSGWPISLRHPFHPARVWNLVDRAISVSGSGEQFFVHDGKRFGHILDPRSGRPATHNLICVVSATSATIAEAMSTAFFVMDTQEVRESVSRREGIYTILVREGPDGKGEELCFGMAGD